MKFFIPAIIIILLFYSECYIKRSTRKKIKQTFPVQPSNYMENPTCKEIVDIINNRLEKKKNEEEKDEVLGDVDTIINKLSDFDFFQNMGIQYEQYKIEMKNLKFFDQELEYESFFFVHNDGYIYLHFSVFPKKFRTAIKNCYKTIKDLNSMDDFNLYNCLGLNYDELRNIITEIISSSVKEFNRDKLKIFYKNRDYNFCKEITNYSSAEDEKKNTGFGYRSINCFLTTDMKKDLPIEYVNGMNEVINKLKLALEYECKKLTVPENGKILYRGQYFKHIIKEGDILANLGFLSTSLEINISKGFAQRSGEYGTLFIIKNTNFNDSNYVKILGKYIRTESDFKREEEVLLLPNQCFKTISINIVEKIRSIELEAVNCKDVREAINF